MTNYILGIMGTWLLCDSIISIRLYLKAMDETGQRMQSWKYDHSIRVIRGLISIGLIVMGGLG
uniref:Uncharacterized protein n=1 Tax=viral metagenome TaxID=1070528 RepID=A0A6M3JQ65_9ZZZZ